MYSPALEGAESVYVLSSASFTLYRYETVPLPVLPLTVGEFADSPYVQPPIDTVGVISALAIVKSAVAVLLL